MSETVRDFLFEHADRQPSREPRPVPGGVALPDLGPITHAAIVPADYARRLGAQLILAADEHDEIVEAGR